MSNMNNKKLHILSDRVIFKRLLGYMKGHYLQFFIALTLMSISVVFNVAVLPLLVEKIFLILDDPDFLLKSIWIIVGIYGVVMLSTYIIQYFQAIIFQKMGQEIMYDIREDVFRSIEQLSVAQLNEIPVGRLVTRVTSDTDTLNQLYTNVIINLIKNVLTIIVAVVMMFCASVKLALLILSITPVLLVASFVFRYYSRRAYRQVRNDISKVNTFLSENLSGMKIIQVFNQEEKKNEEFNQNNKALRHSNLKQIWIFAIFRPLIYVLNMVAYAFIIYFGGKACLAGTMVYATLILFQQLVGKLFEPIQALADQFNVMQSAFAASERIFEVLDTKPIITNSPDAIELDTIKGDIEFKNVWFAYKDDEWVLKDVSFKIKAGQTVAFVGATGSGKTTILSLIVRNYDIQKGQILIDGIDIKKIKIESLRKNIGQMLQDVFLFSGTIFSNIQMNDENITMDDVVRASEYVNLSHFIDKLPNKYNEEVHERGNNFSNGQRQLLSFARTITYKPSVMILDEATANIDTETEVLIQDSLNKMRNIGTMLVVAHRLSTIQHSDNIIVIKHGEKIEEGNHQELLKLHGYYYKLYRLQYEKKQANTK